MELLKGMVEHHVSLVGEMLSRAERLSNNVLDQPIQISVEGIDDGPTLRSQLARLVGQLAMWNAATAGREYDFTVEENESVADLRARLAEAGPAFLENVSTILQEDPPRVFTYGGMIVHVLTFGAHRRTLVCGAFADAGITDLGAGDPME